MADALNAGGDGRLKARHHRALASPNECPLLPFGDYRLRLRG
jgi:hypothetical protein